MTPIFYHLESHLWISYLFFINGFILSCYFSCISSVFKELVSLFEAKVLVSFFISISFNGCLLLLLNMIGRDFSNMLWILPCSTLLFVSLLIVHWSKALIFIKQSFEFSFLRVCFYTLVFLILF